MSSFNQELLKSIDEFISAQSSKVDKKELMEVIKEVFSKDKKSKKDDDVEKIKRKPSPYNNFMKKTMAEFKNNGSEMNAKEKMKRVAELWKEFKNSPQKDEEEEFQDAEEDEPQVAKKDTKKKTTEDKKDPKQIEKAPRKTLDKKDKKDKKKDKNNNDE